MIKAKFDERILYSGTGGCWKGTEKALAIYTSILEAINVAAELGTYAGYKSRNHKRETLTNVTCAIDVEGFYVN